MSLVTAHEFAMPVGTDGDLRFGLDRAKVVRALRDLSHQVELGGTVVQKVSVTSEANPEEFTTTVVTITLVERLAPCTSN